MDKIAIKDWLFRLGIYRGTAAQAPKDLIECKRVYDGANVTRYATELNPNHEMTQWLLTCEGPWAVRMKRPLSQQKTYLAFARQTDAAMFRIMTA